MPCTLDDVTKLAEWDNTNRQQLEAVVDRVGAQSEVILHPVGRQPLSRKTIQSFAECL